MFVDKILKGPRPADLTIEQPTNLSVYKPKDREGAGPRGHTLAARRADESQAAVRGSLREFSGLPRIADELLQGGSRQVRATTELGTYADFCSN
jgi:hypothetical protein